MTERVSNRNSEQHVQRYNRWQGLAIAQTSVAAALLSTLSIAGLATALSLVRSEDFVSILKCKSIFAASFVLFFVSVICSILVVVARTLDFRLTARTVRTRRDPKFAKSLEILWLTSEDYGKLTWFFFWCALLSFLVAGVAIAIAVGSVYAPALFNTTAA